MQTTAAHQEDVKKELLNTDLLRTTFMCQIVRNCLNELTEWKQTSVELSVLSRVLSGSLDEVQQTIAKTADDNSVKWLTQTLQKDKLYDIATVVELMARIGYEEEQTEYEEFVTLLTNCMAAVFYAQQHRKKIFFPKYKAMFNLIADEMKADTNRQPGQMLFSKSGELFLRTTAPDQKSELK